MSAASVSLLAVGAGLGTFLRPVTKMVVVPAEAGCGLFLGGGSVAWVAVPGGGAGVSGAETRVPGGGAKAVLLSCKCRHLAVEVLDLLLKCGAVRGWTKAGKCRLGCDLNGTVCTAGCRVQARLRLEGEHSLDVGGSRLDQILQRKSSGTLGTRILRSLRNCDGLQSPISWSVRSWRMRYSLARVSCLMSLTFSVV
jgi:hypothetical protein